MPQYVGFFNFVIGVPGGSLAPNLLVAPRFADYVRGKDTVPRAVTVQQADLAART